MSSDTSSIYSVSITPYAVGAVADPDMSIVLTAFTTTTITVFSAGRASWPSSKSNSIQYLAIGI